MNKIGQMLDLIYYKAFDSGYTGSGNDQFWNGTSQYKMEKSDQLLTLPLKFVIKRVDILLENNAMFDHSVFVHTIISNNVQNNGTLLIHENVNLEDLIDKIAGTDKGIMYLLDGQHQFHNIAYLEVTAGDDVYQVHTHHTNIVIDASKDDLYLDVNIITHDATAAAASGDLQYVLILGVEIF